MSERYIDARELAEAMGVSLATVSRVVNGDRRVSDGARQRVLDVIRAQNYHPHAAARSLATRRMRSIRVRSWGCGELLVTAPPSLDFL